MKGFRLLISSAFFALMSCSSWGVEPPAQSRRSAEVLPEKKAAESTRVQGRSDPRYRPPAGFTELQAVAGDVARASGRKIPWRLQSGANPGPLVQSRGNLTNCTIYIHPIAASKVPPNTWAFLFGHEFAHFTENLGTHDPTSPSKELKADIVGARYAMAAGYRIEAFLGWVLTEPDQQSRTHGLLHRRVRDIAAHFGVPQAVIQREARRATQYRATH